jgi:hypothetical protein
MLRQCMNGSRSVASRNAIAIPMPAFAEELNRFVTKSKSTMTKRIEKVFRRNQQKLVKIILLAISA